MIQVYAVVRDGDGIRLTGGKMKRVMRWKGLRDKGGVFTEWQKKKTVALIMQK